jgi:nucleoside-diphosphate-sugar epimerase
LTIALERGHRVRAVIRSESNIDDLKSKSTVIAQSIDDKNLEFAVIPDFLKKDAFFEALDGISVIVHLASPLAIEVMGPLKEVVC